MYCTSTVLFKRTVYSFSAWDLFSSQLVLPSGTCVCGTTWRSATTPSPTCSTGTSAWSCTSAAYVVCALLCACSRSLTSNTIADWNCVWFWNAQAEMIAAHEYNRWRQHGVAFELREAAYTISNRTMGCGSLFVIVRSLCTCTLLFTVQHIQNE